MLEELIKENEAEAKEYLAKKGLNLRYRYWASMAQWELEEALALTIDVEPAVLNKSSFPENVKKYLLLKLHEVREPIRREWLGVTIRPLWFVKWAQSHYIDFPKELAELVLALDPTRKKLQDKPQEILAEKPMGARERATLLEIILGMAIDKYGYDASAPDKKSDVPKAINNSLMRAGITNPPSAETIRKKLRLAAGFSEEDN